MPHDSTEAFLAALKGYPNQNGQARAASAWCAIVEAGFAGGEPALSAAILARFESGQLAHHPYTGDARFRPTFETYLKEFRWLEADSKPNDAEPAKLVETFEQRDARARREAAERTQRERERVDRLAREALAAASGGGQ